MPAISLPQLNPYERKKLLLLSVITFLFVTIWTLFSPSGTFQLFSVQSDLAQIENENISLRAENDSLRTEINMLKNDSDYVEQVAREKGLLKRDEMVFVFK